MRFAGDVYSTRGSRLRIATALAIVIVFGAVSVAATIDIFRVFRNDVGTVQSATADPNVLNGDNKFFDHNLGTNGQACSTCHEPDQSFGLEINHIRGAFLRTLFRPQLDPIFRLNDTADRPDADESNPLARVIAYRLALELGTTRIARPIPANANFIATLQGANSSPAYSSQFGTLPNTNDPQALRGTPTLSLFRRPLVNTNVHFDSAVLWDGRANVNAMDAQVQGAARTLLLSADGLLDANGEHRAGNQISAADAHEVASFMLGVFTDQASVNGVGSLSSDGATGGVQNLLALSTTYPVTDCDAANPTACPVTLGAPNMHMFDAWASNPDPDKRAVARGQDVFNNVVLHKPGDLNLPGFANIPSTGPNAGEMHCTTCHGVPDVGNNPYHVFLGRLGTDSVQILTNLRNSRPDLPSLQEFVSRLKLLPQYCFRAKKDVYPDAPILADVPCGQFAGSATVPADVLSTDPGKALNGVAGNAVLTEIGKFKPPVLRALAGRAPYFHQGGAKDLDTLIDFYDARFSIHLTKQQHRDLKAFLDAF